MLVGLNAALPSHQRTVICEVNLIVTMDHLLKKYVLYRLAISFWISMICTVTLSDSALALTSTQRFSAPDPSLYTLNDRTERSFPRVIDSPFGGNGHASSWDGRVYIVTRSGGRWQAQVLRPERIARTNDGINLRDAFSARVDFDLDTNRIGVPGRQIRAKINWLAIVPDPSAGLENPLGAALF